MSHDNEWMKEKISMYRREFGALEEKSVHLEQENVKLIRYLFECNNEELDMVKCVIFDFSKFPNLDLYLCTSLLSLIIKLLQRFP